VAESKACRKKTAKSEASLNMPHNMKHRNAYNTLPRSVTLGKFYKLMGKFIKRTLK
jgi:hypothetical protein